MASTSNPSKLMHLLVESPSSNQSIDRSTKGATHQLHCSRGMSPNVPWVGSSLQAVPETLQPPCSRAKKCTSLLAVKSVPICIRSVPRTRSIRAMDTQFNSSQVVSTGEQVRFMAALVVTHTNFNASLVLTTLATWHTSIYRVTGSD